MQSAALRQWVGSPLSTQVGSSVEVKTNEGVSSEAVISKLTDASLYTVGESLHLIDWWIEG